MYTNSISTKEYFSPKNNKISFHANPIIDTFERTSKRVSCAETKELVLSYLKKNKKNISERFSNASYFDLSMKDRLLKSIAKNREDYFFGNNPIGDIDNIEEYFSSYKKINFDEKISLMTEIANKNNAKYLDFWCSHPEMLLAYVNSNGFVPYQIKNFSSKTWDIMIGSFVKIFDSPNMENNVQAVLRYSNDNGYKAINTMLRLKPVFDSYKNSKKLNPKISNERLKDYCEKILAILDNSASIIHYDNEVESFIKNDIKNLLKFLKEEDSIISVDSIYLLKKLDSNITMIKQFWKDAQLEKTFETINDLMIEVKEDGEKIHLIRTGSLKEMNNLTINNKKLHSDFTMDDLSPNIIEDMNKNLSIIKQDSFLSTSISPYLYMKQPVNYDLTLDNNLKCLYLSDVRGIFDGCSTEAELLIQPNAAIKINSARKENEKIFIKGIISNGS